MLSFDTVLLLAQTLSLATITAWLATGVWDNILHPENNETYTAEVMSLKRMAEDYPDEFARVAHRAITSRQQQQIAFRIVVGAELLATLVLVIGVIAMLMALAGTGDVATGRAIALLGAMLFTCVWGGFLVVGNYFCYWFCHEGGQNTHFQMTLWGMANMIFLTAG